MTINTDVTVWKTKDIHYNHQTLCILAKIGSITTKLLPNNYAYRKSSILSLGGTVLTIVVPTQMHFFQLSHSIWLYRSCGRLLHGDWHCNYHSKLASQGVFTKCPIFQISHLIVTVKFIPLWGYLQLDHPVTCENIK